MASRKSVIVRRVRRYTGLTYNEARELLDEGVMCPWCDHPSDDLRMHVWTDHERGLESNRIEEGQRTQL